MERRFFHLSASSRLCFYVIAVLLTVALGGEAFAFEGESSPHERTISILGVTVSSRGPIGTVTSIVLTFQERTDQTGLMIGFTRGPGRLSRMAQTSVQQAIYRVARMAKLSTDSWTVTISVPTPITIYGDSLSAMVGLTVIALAKRDTIAEDCIITGGIAPDGHISNASGLALKLAAASKSHIRQVLVPDEFDPAEPDWQTPFLMHVSPVDSVQQAYQTLTGSPIN
ncbi:MAG TPA: S16 family serine protease [Nitrospira sp.]|nr:S16 family serine protease [Nitrospira sp.]